MGIGTYLALASVLFGLGAAGFLIGSLLMLPETALAGVVRPTENTP